MKKYVSAVMVFSLLLLSSCANMNKAQTGAAGGAAAGALIGQAIGKNTGGTLIGAAVGTMLGYVIGNEMDKNDKQKLNNVFESGQSGQPTTWVNPDTGNKFQATPQPAYKNANAQVCRDAQVKAVIDGKKEIMHSTACRDQSGQWRVKG